jgi:hypothetical protein
MLNDPSESRMGWCAMRHRWRIARQRWVEVKAGSAITEHKATGMACAELHGLFPHGVTRWHPERRFGQHLRS